MTPIAALSFALAMLILAAVPGPGVMATVARALASGFRPALAVIGGIILGDIIYLLFAIFGLSVLAQTLGHYFVMIKIIGGGYLVWLGLKMLFSDVRTNRHQTGTRYGNFFSGLLITLGNPKVILFYCGFLPTFMSLAELTFMDVLLVSGIVALVLLSVLGCYAWLAGSARSLLQTPAKRLMLDRTGGTVMIMAGTIIASRS